MRSDGGEKGPQQGDLCSSDQRHSPVDVRHAAMLSASDWEAGASRRRAWSRPVWVNPSRLTAREELLGSAGRRPERRWPALIASRRARSGRTSTGIRCRPRRAGKPSRATAAGERPLVVHALGRDRLPRRLAPGQLRRVGARGHAHGSSRRWRRQRTDLVLGPDAMGSRPRPQSFLQQLLERAQWDQSLGQHDDASPRHPRCTDHVPARPDRNVEHPARRSRWPPRL